MEKNCNVISLTKISSLDSQNVEFDKVLDAILSNHQFIIFESTLDEAEKNSTYDTLNLFVKDIVNIHNTIVNDLTMNMQFNQRTGEFEVSVVFLQTGPSLDSGLFDYAIEYSDKYEDIIINNNLVGVIFFDFNSMTKNENLHIITKYSDGTVVDNG